MLARSQKRSPEGLVASQQCFVSRNDLSEVLTAVARGEHCKVCALAQRMASETRLARILAVQRVLRNQEHPGCFLVVFAAAESLLGDHSFRRVDGMLSDHSCFLGGPWSDTLDP